jgi:secreted trypsin-like serine protease
MQNACPIMLGIVSSGISTYGRCKNETYTLYTDVFKFVDWIKTEVESGYLIASIDDTQDFESFIKWKSIDVFCDFREENL